MCRRTESKLAKKLKELSESEAECKKAHDKVLYVAYSWVKPCTTVGAHQANSSNYYALCIKSYNLVLIVTYHHNV